MGGGGGGSPEGGGGLRGRAGVGGGLGIAGEGFLQGGVLRSAGGVAEMRKQTTVTQRGVKIMRPKDVEEEERVIPISEILSSPAKAHNVISTHKDTLAIRSYADRIVKAYPYLGKKGTLDLEIYHALSLVYYVTRGRMNDAGIPYIEEAVSISLILGELGLHKEHIIAGLLHNCMLVSHLTAQDISDVFGDHVSKVLSNYKDIVQIGSLAR